MPEPKDSKPRRGSRGRKPRGTSASTSREDEDGGSGAASSGASSVPPPAMPIPPLSRYAEDSGVNRDEVAAREAGIYDEEPDAAAPPSRSSGRRSSGTRSRGRRGARREKQGESGRKVDEPDEPKPEADRSREAEAAPEAPRKPRRRRRPRQDRAPEPAPADLDAGEPEVAEEGGERLSWWDEIEDEIEDVRGIDEDEVEILDEFETDVDGDIEDGDIEDDDIEDGPETNEEEHEVEADVAEEQEEEDDFLAGIFPDDEEADEEADGDEDGAAAAEAETAEVSAAEPVAVPAAETAAPAAPPTEQAVPDLASGVSRRWIRETFAPAVEKSPERRTAFVTSSGVELAPLYGPSADAARAFEDHVGYPGEFPFTRGVQATMYRGRHWTMRQYAGFGSAKATNERFLYLLEQGQTGLSVAFDLPTQIGYDSDDPASEGEVGKVGVPINSLRDMEVLLEGIPLDKVSLSMTINSTAAVLLLMVVAVAKKQGVSLEQVRGTVQNDMLKEFVARNTYRFSLDAHLRLVTDLFRYSSANLPKFNMISISGYHMREAGCTAVQEVAFTLANAIAYVEKAIEAGLDVDAFAGRLSFFFGAHNNLFEEVAKFRAARRLWAKIMRDRFGAKDPKSMMLRFHTQTCGSTLTARQPKVNVVRVAMQALASVLGGTQSLHTNSWDEALSLPSKESALLALRTQQVIANESGVADVIDPLGGSPLVEELTDQVEAGAIRYLEKIDELGGAPAAIRSGWMKGEIEAAAYKAQKEIESGEQVVVGVNEFTMPDEEEPGIFPVDEQQAVNVLADLAKLRAERNDSKVEAALAALEISAAWGDGDLPDLILACVESYCTIGEICRSLETVLAADK